MKFLQGRAGFQRNFAGALVFNPKDTMKSEPIQNLLRELVWRRKLTDTQRAELRASPEAQADLELESRLTEGLAGLPDAAVPSNFVARVLQAIEREELQPARKRGWPEWNWRTLLPRTAAAAAVVALAALTVQHHELNVRRAQLAQNVAQFASTQPMPNLDALKNFNAIQRMGQPRADEELLALLQ
jgi:negative regulator of sigma E activity